MRRAGSGLQGGTAAPAHDARDRSGARIRRQSAGLHRQADAPVRIFVHRAGQIGLRLHAEQNFRLHADKRRRRAGKEIVQRILARVRQQAIQSRNFRVFGPDETASNRLQDLFEATNRAWNAETFSYDDHLAPDGRVMEILSEHTCQGWLEGYLLTGRHGFFSCYEAFIHIVDSMFNQHAKWLKTSKEVAWRRPIASLNYLLTSHV